VRFCPPPRCRFQAQRGCIPRPLWRARLRHQEEARSLQSSQATSGSVAEAARKGLWPRSSEPGASPLQTSQQDDSGPAVDESKVSETLVELRSELHELLEARAVKPLEDLKEETEEALNGLHKQLLVSGSHGFEAPTASCFAHACSVRTSPCVCPVQRSTGCMRRWQCCSLLLEGF